MKELELTWHDENPDLQIMWANTTMAYKILPLLKAFREYRSDCTDYPIRINQELGLPPRKYSEEGLQLWHKAIDDMVFAFEYIVENSQGGYNWFPPNANTEAGQRLFRGFELFGKYYYNLQQFSAMEMN